MRHLIIHRQRALMGFGLSYFCILDQTRDGFLARLEGLSRAECNALEGPTPITNGQTIEVPVTLASIPMFLRGSAVVVTTEDVKHILKDTMRQIDQQKTQNEEMQRILSGDSDDVTEWVARDSYNYAAANERIFVDVTGN